jgi:hypothetical protein
MRSAKNTKIAGAALLVHRIELLVVEVITSDDARAEVGGPERELQTTSVLVLRRAYRTEGGAN